MVAVVKGVVTGTITEADVARAKAMARTSVLDQGRAARAARLAALVCPVFPCWSLELCCGCRCELVMVDVVAIVGLWWCHRRAHERIDPVRIDPVVVRRAGLARHLQRSTRRSDCCRHVGGRKIGSCLQRSVC